MPPEILEQRRIAIPEEGISAAPHFELKRKTEAHEFTRTLPIDLGTSSGWFNVAGMMLGDSLWLVALSALVISLGTWWHVDAIRCALLVSIWTVGVVGAFYLFGLYQIVMPLPAVEVRRLVLTLWTSALLMSASLAAMATQWKTEIILLPALAVLASCTLPFIRHLSRRFLSRLNLWGRRVLIVGGNERAAMILKKLTKSARLGLRPVGVLEDLECLHASLHPDVCLGPAEKLAAIAEEYAVSMVIFVPSDIKAYDLMHLFHDSESRVNTWMVVPPTSKLPALWTEAFDLTGQPALGWQNHISSWWHRSLKRAFDLAIIGVFAPVWVPLMVAISIAIKLGGGSIFFVQERVGYRGKKFNCLKFRTMYVNGKEILDMHLKAHPELRAEWERNFKLKNDPRVTWIGKYLRKTSLDELPQLLNVLRGEMSLVGPRPLLESELPRYGESYSSYIQMHPGITGLWQISGRSNTTFAERAWNDEYYVRNWSPWYDLYILGCTVQVVLRCEGAY